jgi:thiol-disulfide isomerase/thioredoxin
VYAHALRRCCRPAWHAASKVPPPDRDKRAAERPGRRYSQVVGLFFLVIIGVATLNAINTRDSGVLGLKEETHELPLAEFAVPEAKGALEGDANIAQDDCETSQNPCPAEKRRKPACEVRGEGIITVCDYFARPLVISFWFTRGGNCEAQQDVVSRVSERYRGRVNFLSIDIHDSRQDIRDLVNQRGWRMPVGIDSDGAVSDLYRIGGCPTFVYAYPGGILMRSTIGELGNRSLAGNTDRLLAASAKRARISR